MSKEAEVTSKGLWMATVEFRSSQARAFGTSPEEAVKALVERWQESCLSDGRGDPFLVHDTREEVDVYPFETGTGYVMGVTDSRWFKGGLKGDDRRFDAVFDDLVAHASPGP